MTVRELIEDLQNNFANHMDLEVQIAERERGKTGTSYLEE